jgi:hypothetical protein
LPRTGPGTVTGWQVPEHNPPLREAWAVGPPASPAADELDSKVQYHHRQSWHPIQQQQL